MDQDQDQQASDDKAYRDLAEEIDPTPEKPEPEPEKKPEPEPAKHTVPLATFLESQNEIKRLRIEMQAENVKTQAETAKWAKVEERLNILNQRMTEPEPDEEKDPLGWQKAQITKQQKSTEEIRRNLEGFQEQFGRLSAQQQIAQAVATQEQEFAATQPDYWQAADHLRAARMAQHRIMGMDDAAAAKVFSDECKWLVQNAMRANKNPAQVTYELAKSMGFVAKPNGAVAAAAVVTGTLTAK